MSERWMVVKRCCDQCPSYGAVTEIVAAAPTPLGAHCACCGARAIGCEVIVWLSFDGRSYPYNWLRKMPPDKQVHTEETEEVEA